MMDTEELRKWQKERENIDRVWHWGMVALAIVAAVAFLLLGGWLAKDQKSTSSTPRGEATPTSAPPTSAPR